jgi:hypothetical protein
MKKYKRRPNPLYMTVSQIAEKYDFHPNTVRSWCRDELLPYVRGRRDEYLIRISDLEKFFHEWYS